MNDESHVEMVNVSRLPGLLRPRESATAMEKGLNVGNICSQAKIAIASLDGLSSGSRGGIIPVKVVPANPYLVEL